MLLHTQYTCFRPCGFREEDLFIFSHYKPMVSLANLCPRDTVGRIYEGDYKTLLQTKYESSVSHGFREEYFLCFPHYNPMGTIRRHGIQSSNLIWHKPNATFPPPQ